jgi:hypothetical protein
MGAELPASSWHVGGGDAFITARPSKRANHVSQDRHSPEPEMCV